ncbi:MAG TPA: hypothetical protein VKE24_07135 [Candidatus Acidoferrales bacterium]|nr:hypothetical protein [Candidatus Acidoferrales bacterium]
MDPNTTPLRSEPRDVRDVMIAAANGWCLPFDNVSHLTGWLSDAICRLSTGGGFSTRELYSDDQEKLFEATRPVIINGIDGLVVRGDLADRAITLFLPTIPDGRRRAEADFWKAFRAARPRIFGALLQAVAAALNRLPKLSLDRLPRMADFALWVTAAEPALGWEDGTLLCVYETSRKATSALTLEASPVVPAIQRLAEQGPWSGTATGLLRELTLHADAENEYPQRSWPKSPWALSVQLRRLALDLRAMGVDVLFGKTPGGGSKRTVTIKKCAGDRDACDARAANSS